MKNIVINIVCLIGIVGCGTIEYHNKSTTVPLPSENTEENILDSDGDGIIDYQEKINGTNPLKKDTDDDGKNDQEEGILDSDGDGIIDAIESIYQDRDNDGVSDENDAENKNPYNDSDGDGVSNMDEKNKGTNPLDKNDIPKELLQIQEDNTSKIKFHTSKIEFYPRNDYPIDDQIKTKLWSQDIVYLDNGFYLMSQNVKQKRAKKDVDKYLLFNLFDAYGRSVGNTQVNYASHGQGLSFEKIDNNYYIYTGSDNGREISCFIFNTSSIDFNTIQPSDKQLDIEYYKDIVIDPSSLATSITPTLNEAKDKFATVGYISSKKIRIQVTDKNNGDILSSRDFDLNITQNGTYNQGIAMKNDYIYVVRGHYLAKDDNKIKKLFVFDQKSQTLVKSYSFSLNDSHDFYRVEPEGLTIIDNTLYVNLPTKETKTSRHKMRLYRLLDL